MQNNHPGKPYIRVRSGRVFLLLFMACLVFFGGHCFAYWLPWASEEDKVKKSLREIWQALLNNDKRTAQLYLDGPGVDAFIQQELDQIKRYGITKYDFNIGQISLAQSGQSFAYVKFDKIAHLKDGNEMKTPALGVFRRVGGMWRYITGLGVPPKKPDDSIDPSKAMKTLTDAMQRTAPTSGEVTRELSSGATGVANE